MEGHKRKRAESQSITYLVVRGEKPESVSWKCADTLMHTCSWSHLSGEGCSLMNRLMT